MKNKQWCKSLKKLIASISQQNSYLDNYGKNINIVALSIGKRDKFPIQPWALSSSLPYRPGSTRGG